MTNEEMSALVVDYLNLCQEVGMDQEALPLYLQKFGNWKFGTVLGLWELEPLPLTEPEGGSYRFEVRLGYSETGPVMCEWFYHPLF